jgi:hypothetical protein
MPSSPTTGDLRLGLDELKGQVASRLETAATADAELAKQAREGISIATIAALFRRAQELGAISEDGLRVEVPSRWERLRFQMPVNRMFPNAPSLFRVSVEYANGGPSGISVFWSQNQTAIDMLAAVAEAWKRAGEFRVTLRWTPNGFERLIRTLQVAIKSRSRDGDEQLSPVIELLGSKWAMTDYGLEYLEEYYPIDRGRLLTDKAVANWRRHMSEKIWAVEDDKLAGASNGEPDFWMVTEIAHMFFAAHKEGD